MGCELYVPIDSIFVRFGNTKIQIGQRLFRTLFLYPKWNKSGCIKSCKLVLRKKCLCVKLFISGSHNGSYYEKRRGLRSKRDIMKSKNTIYLFSFPANLSIVKYNNKLVYNFI